MKRAKQAVLLVATLLGSWLGMQLVHEIGHVVGAWMSGGQVDRVVLHPFTLSRTDLGQNPNPLVVAWAGPLFGVVVPLALWQAGREAPVAYLLRFFAGFCLVANGVYLGLAPLRCAGDCVTLLANGAGVWQLVAFGVVAFPLGLWLWHGESGRFAARPDDAYIAVVVCASLALLGVVVDGR